MGVSVAIVAAGVVLVVAGLTWLFGPWALVLSGVSVAAVGLLIDEERLSGKPASTPPR